MKKIILVFTTILHLASFAQDNQNVEMKSISSKRYGVYKAIKKGYNDEVLEKAKKTWPVEVFNQNGIYPKILIKKVGIVDEFYKADLPDFPAYYHGENTIVISVLNQKIYYYEWSASQGATIKYILTDKNVSNYKIEKQLIDSYRRSIIGKQTGTRDVRIKDKEIAKKKEEKENTLEGKSIQSITVKVVNKDAKLGMFSVINIGMEVLLTNGTVLKTKNLGGKTPYSDFDTKTSGGAFSGGDFKVSNVSSEISNDRIEIEVWSKYNTKTKGKLVQPLNYKTDVFYYFKANGGKHGRGNVSGRSKHGGNGSDARSVNVLATKLFINGENVIELRVTDYNTGRLLSVAKLNVVNKVTINVEGGSGGDGDSGSMSGGHGGDGGNGGDGGSIHLSGTGVSSLNIISKVSGGSKGTGGSAKSSAYRNGSSGYSGSKGSVYK